jgi:glycosyltransferase involved in cell wall biosynthesis
VTVVALPQIPLHGSLGLALNLALFRSYGWRLLRSMVSSTDLIHSVQAFPGLLASDFARRARIHHVFQATGGDVNTMLPRIKHAPVAAGWERHIHGVACVAKRLEEAFKQVYPHVPNIRTTYRGVDLERFQPGGVTMGPLTGRPPVRYLFLGGFPPYPTERFRENTKGGMTLLAAWQAAEPELIRANASLLIAGPDTGHGRMAQWRARLKDPGRVHIQDNVSPHFVSAYIRSSDAVLLPSMQEGLPNVAMEASACARPVFGSDVGGIPEVVSHGRTGLILPAGHVPAWTSVLQEYAGHAPLLASWGQCARARMETLFDHRAYAPQMVDLYQTALNERLN